MAYLFEHALPEHTPADDPVARDVDHLGLHEENLYDEDERKSDGAKYNELTGEPYDNSTETDETLISQMGHIVSLEFLERRQKLLERRDAAAVWLAEHDQSRAA